MKRMLAVAATVLLATLLFAPPVLAQDRDCSSFDSQPEAQRFFEDEGPGDPHRLDRDNDGIACESLAGGDGTTMPDSATEATAPDAGVSAAVLLALLAVLGVAGRLLARRTTVM